MKIELGLIRYDISIPEAELIPDYSLDSEQLKHDLLAYDPIHKCQVSDEGVLVWIEVWTLPETTKGEVLVMVKSVLKNLLS